MDEDEIREAVREAVEEALEDIDIESKIEDAIDGADIEGKLEDAIAAAVENTLVLMNANRIMVRSRDRKKVLPLCGGTEVRQWKNSWYVNLQTSPNNWQSIDTYPTEAEAVAAMDRILAAQLAGEKLIEL